MTTHESLTRLKQVLKRGDTVYTVLRHVSRSGMQRHIDVYVIRDNKPIHLSYHIAEVLDYKITGSSIEIRDYATDMGVYIIYNLSVALFCPKKWDKDAAYALKQEWL